MRPNRHPSFGHHSVERAGCRWKEPQALVHDGLQIRAPLGRRKRPDSVIAPAPVFVVGRLNTRPHLVQLGPQPLERLGMCEQQPEDGTERRARRVAPHEDVYRDHVLDVAVLEMRFGFLRRQHLAQHVVGIAAMGHALGDPLLGDVDEVRVLVGEGETRANDGGQEAVEMVSPLRMGYPDDRDEDTLTVFFFF